jgi:hypothetical protein
MTNEQVIADVVALSPTLVAIVALLLNYRGFASIDNRFSSLESSVNSRFTSIERRLDLMQTDMKDLNKAMTGIEVDVALLKDRAKLP